MAENAAEGVEKGRAVAAGHIAAHVHNLEKFLILVIGV
jgi:hypothetical protein